VDDSANSCYDKCKKVMTSTKVSNNPKSSRSIKVLTDCVVYMLHSYYQRSSAATISCRYQQENSFMEKASEISYEKRRPFTLVG
jgi:hypothetical protein